MATWGQILGEIQNALPSQGGNAFNNIRNKYMKILSDYTGRDTIIYATRWTSGDMPPIWSQSLMKIVPIIRKI